MLYFAPVVLGNFSTVICGCASACPFNFNLSENIRFGKPLSGRWDKIGTPSTYRHSGEESGGTCPSNLADEFQKVAELRGGKGPVFRNCYPKWNIKTLHFR